MAFVPEQQINTGSYLPTTSVYDVARIQEVDVKSPEFKELLVRLYQTVNNLSIVLNTKDSGLYVQEEFVTGQQFFNAANLNQLFLRGTFRKTIDCGALAAGLNTIPHGLTPTATWTFTKILGAATNSVTLTYVPLPFPGAAGNNIEVIVNNLNILITNNSGLLFDRSIIILEYMKVI